jgi:hypothetical protein
MLCAGHCEQPRLTEDTVNGIGAYLGGPSEIAGRAPLLGQPAPEFELADEQGNGVTLRRLTRRGPVLLHLYRGHW